MAEFRNILFDLDGTITDPGIGITSAIMYALDKMGIEVPERHELYKFIGPPLWDSFEKYYGLSYDEADRAVELYREYYTVKGIFESSLNEGIEDLLKKLKDSGKNIVLATSKPEPFAKQVINSSNLTDYFDFIAGSNLDRTRSDKAEVIKYALSSCNISDIHNTIMIGDREHDILGAKKNNIQSIGVLFGYGSREELESAGADFIAENAKDLEALLLMR